MKNPILLSDQPPLVGTPCRGVLPRYGVCAGLFAASAVFLQAAAATLSFTVSMEKPDTHLCHVDFQCDGLDAPTQDFKMPAWTPGYYRVMNYAKNVSAFTAQDANGHPLVWEKANTNTWRVHTANATTITVSYDVTTTQPIFETSLSPERGFIAPTDLFMHPAGQLGNPVTVKLKLPSAWTHVATGLDPVAGQSNTFRAPNFDILYDCPMLMGNLETLHFKVQGIPHEFAGLNWGEFDRTKFTSDLQRMVSAATGIMGDIPYQHYTFIAAGMGGGGIEHLNSCTIGFRGASVTNLAGVKREMSFIAHEYFHLYNVKRIRPVVLGPFDYDQENRTHMLWVSEGFTVYYEWMILRRAGILKAEDVWKGLQTAIVAYENKPGHLFQSAAQSSWETWTQQPFTRTNPAVNKTISYYEKGAVLGALLDLKIRHETKNQKSLDDVMRTLYREYYQEKQRGFTDEEFREVCERIAGTRLSEFFDYANTVKNVNYPKYFGYAGLEIAMPRKLAEPSFGATVRDRDGKLIVSTVEWASAPALAAQDEITSVNGATINAEAFNKLIDAAKPGDKIQIEYSHEGATHPAKIAIGNKMERTFQITPKDHPSALEKAILIDWLRGP